MEHGWSVAKVMRTAGLSDRVWYNWLEAPHFVEALAKAKKGHEEAVWTRLRAAAGVAAETIITIAENAEEKGSVRLMAANSILDRGGFKQADAVVVPVQPYQTREELVAALASIPADVLTDALAKVGK